eukprot:2667283-Prymnesium_polylepis.1
MGVRYVEPERPKDTRTRPVRPIEHGLTPRRRSRDCPTVAADEKERSGKSVGYVGGSKPSAPAACLALEPRLLASMSVPRPPGLVMAGAVTNTMLTSEPQPVAVDSSIESVVEAVRSEAQQRYALVHGES